MNHLDIIKELRGQITVPEDNETTEAAASAFAALLQADEAEKPRIPGIVMGRVVAINESVGYVVVDFRHKSEGRVPLHEFMVDGRLSVEVGDEVQFRIGSHAATCSICVRRGTARFFRSVEESAGQRTCASPAVRKQNVRGRGLGK